VTSDATVPGAGASPAAGADPADASAAESDPAGWTVLHLFCHTGPDTDREAALTAMKRAREHGDQVVTTAILGHKADIGVMAIGPDPWRLRDLQGSLERAGLHAAASYVSLTEVSEYAAGLPEEMKEARLHPRLPPEDKPAFCFYPMSKRRGPDANWYTLSFDERVELMRGHGRVGRLFHGRILQLITGSTGLDEWEWGVTLFGRGLDDLKDCVYQMRFDEASARYAEFGPFWTGMVADAETVLSRVLGP
jgi:chlorite dismutase